MLCERQGVFGVSSYIIIILLLDSIIIIIIIIIVRYCVPEFVPNN